MVQDRPSDTASVIAINRVLSARDPVLRRVLQSPDEPYSRWFVEAHSARLRRTLRILSLGPVRRLLFGFGERAYPGGLLHILSRKRFIEDAVRSFLKAAGGEERQFLVLGAGLDPLALRLLPDFPSVTIYEIDHPATQEVKRRALEQHRATDSRLVLLPVDFSRETAADKLASSGFRRDVPTFFLAEGLLMYLSSAEVDGVFDLVARFGAPGSRFVFTHLDRAVLENPDSTTAAVSRRLARTGEPLRTSLTRGELEAYVKKRRLRLLEIIDHRDLRRLYVEPLGIDRPVIAGELMGVTEVEARAVTPTRGRR